MFDRLFLEHPRSVNESYFDHFKMALSFSVKLFSAAFACLVHAIVPGFCVKTGSRLIQEIHEDMVKFRVKKSSDGHKVEQPIDTIEYMI